MSKKLVEITFNDVLKMNNDENIICKHELLEKNRMEVPYEFSMFICDLGGVFNGKEVRTILKDAKWYIEKEEKKRDNIIKFPTSKTNETKSVHKVSPMTLYPHDMVLNDIGDFIKNLISESTVSNNKLLYEDCKYGNSFIDIDNTTTIKYNMDDEFSNQNLHKLATFCTNSKQGNVYDLSSGYKVLVAIIYRITADGYLYLLSVNENFEPSANISVIDAGPDIGHFIEIRK